MQTIDLKLPKFLIVKVVLFHEETINDFLFITDRTKFNMKQLMESSILSYHPLIIKVDNVFYHLKQLNEMIFILLIFVLIMLMIINTITWFLKIISIIKVRKYKNENNFKSKQKSC